MTDETSNTSTGTTGKATADPATSESATPTKVGKRQLPQVHVDVKKIRTAIAKIVWAVCAFFALVLAAAVLLVAIDANTNNDLVQFIGETSDKIDLGLFDLSDPIKDFKPNDNGDTGTVLFNYGIAAVAWLVIGRILDRVIRP